MKRLWLVLFLLPVLGFSQAFQRQFWTTNTHPWVLVSPGTNCFVTYHLLGSQTNQFVIDIPASAGSGQTNVTILTQGTNCFVSSTTNNGVITYTIDVPTQLQQTNWSLADITNLTALQISWQQITNVASIQIPLASVTNAGSIAYSNANSYVLSLNGLGTNITLYGSSGVTNFTYTTTNGWWNTNNTATNQGVNIVKGNINADSNIVSKVGAFYGNGSGLTNINQSAITNALPRVLGITIDGGGNTISSGTKGFLEVPYAATVKAGTLLADQNGSIQIETWRTNAGNLTLLARAGSLGTNFLTSTNWSKDYALSGWSSVAISSNDILGFVVTTNAASCTRVTLQLQVQP